LAELHRLRVQLHRTRRVLDRPPQPVSLYQTERQSILVGQHSFPPTVGFVPFSTSLLGLYPFSPTAVRVYGANLAATGLALYAVWWYATSQYRLVEKDLDPHIVSLAKRRIIVGPIVSLLGIGFSFLDTRISLVLYLLLIPFFIRPSHIDIHFRGGSHN